MILFTLSESRRVKIPRILAKISHAPKSRKSQLEESTPDEKKLLVRDVAPQKTTENKLKI